MDWKEIVGWKVDKINDENRDAVWNAILGFQDFGRADNKSFKKLFRLSHKLMHWKDEEVTQLNEQLKELNRPPQDDGRAQQEQFQSATVENGKLRKLVERLENEKTQQKVKLRQLTEEIAVMQKRVQNTSERDVDSPDALSDLEKQEELLTNISVKNKHIKRLLTDFEELEGRHAKQAKEAQLARNQLHEATLGLESLNAQFKDSQVVIKDQIKLIEELNGKNQTLDEIISAMQRDVDERDEEITAFGRELEQKVLVWKRMFDSKQNELESLKIKYEDIVDRHPGYNIDAERAELVRLTSSVKERDFLINDLEEKVFEMSNELITATEVINKLLIKERELKERTNRPRSGDCCSESKVLLGMAKKEVLNLQETILALEEENLSKTKQAMESIETLSKYENGEAGLSEALKQISELERKIRVRDRDIKELVKQINRSQDVAKENIALREQVGIDENEVVPTTFIEAKMRKLEKANERVTLKLRASEEMRLKMKLERNELMKQLSRKEEDLEDHSSSPESDQPQPGKEERERVRLAVEELRRKEAKWTKEQERMEASYEVISKENDNLRVGMFEILNQLQSGGEDTLDSRIISRLLNVLDTDRSDVLERPAKRPQMEIPKKDEFDGRSPQVPTVAEKKAIQDNSSQTANDYQKETHDAAGFEDILVHIKEVVEENSAITEELMQLKAVNQELTKDSPHNDAEDHLSLQSKCEFLLEENGLLCRRLRTSKDRMVKMLHQIQKKFVELQINQESHAGLSPPDQPPPIQDINSSITQLKASLCSNFFKDIQGDDLWSNIRPGVDSEKVAVIDEDIQVRNFITTLEYNQLVDDGHHKERQLKELSDRNKVLEETLKLTTFQVDQHRMMVNRNSDEEISLRHLVVDLQSTGSENQLIARGHRELMIAVEGRDTLIAENQELRSRIAEVEGQMKDVLLQKEKEMENKQQEMQNNAVKLKYLKKTLAMMCDKYGKYTPLLDIETVIEMFKRLKEEKEAINKNENISRIIDEQLQRKREQANNVAGNNSSEQRIELIRWTTQCELLQDELKMLNEKMRQLENELHENRLEAMRNNQHWMTLDVLFKRVPQQEDPQGTETISKNFSDAGVQVALEDTATKSPTKDSPQVITPEPTPAPRRGLQKESTFDAADQSSPNNKCLESQLKQAMSLASTRSGLLLETENRLAEAQGRVKALERCLEERQKWIKEHQSQKEGLELEKRDENVFSITIASLQNLLLEKDTTLSRYQELLKTERMEHSKSCSEFQLELEAIKTRNDDLNRKIKERDSLLEELNRRFSDLEGGSHQSQHHDGVEKGSREVDAADEMSFNLLDSNRIDDIYVTESKEFELAEKQMELQEVDGKWRLADEEVRRLQGQLMEVSKRESGWESALAERDLEVETLNRRLKEEGNTRNTDRSLEELRDMLEEKDRHIHDLTKTLTHFHDDQHNYIKDSTISSAEDLARMTSDISRTDASNKVLNTQLEALKRQMANLEQREKQAREMVKTLKQQLMKRPVISVGKTLHKEDQYQRKIESLQSELALTKEELRKQTNLAEQRRTKGQQELQLWEKQKRAQQCAEKLKMRLSDREQELEKVKCQLAAARQAVSRLEREKQLLEGKRNAGGHCCQSPSCPGDRRSRNSDNRRPAAETPETEGDEEEEGVTGYYGEIVGVTALPKQWQESNSEVIKALKARVEVQQRKIVAMELEGKGSNVISLEVEKLQERMANVESQNLRLEAKNLQLQLENDLLRKGDVGERQQRQIKHLEDYILGLKEELSQAVAVASTVDVVPVKLARAGAAAYEGTKSTANMEQTILALKRIVERLRMENKALKDGRTGVGLTPSTNQQKTVQELKRVQDLYAEALNKITANEMEKNCRADGTPRDAGELKVTMLKLEQKTQLLEKAKVLLTRAAAKEKNLREQIEMWKRKCSELQNVPVIEEISE